jgi:ABC-type uncharacterized transport system ATPase subunit
LANLRNNEKGQFIVRIQFGSDLSAADLKAIKGLQSAVQDGKTWKLTGDHENFRQTVSQFALANNYEVLELISEKNSLEEIFRKLTSHVGDI